MAKTILGTCHFCGTYGKLSFEHVPPEAAFNDQRVLHMAFESFLTSETLDRVPGRYQQRGAGACTLCIPCNNNTGHWYGGAYAEWAHQAMSIIIGTRGKPTLEYPFNLFPLRVLKQVVCMFFSVNGPLFQAHQPDLVRFVLNRDSQMFPDHIKVYAFYTFSDRSRAAGVSGVFTGLGSARSKTHIFSEITFPPFGFVMTFADHAPPQPDFCDISGFSRFGYKEWRAGITMKLPLMPIYTPYPGDYRTRAQTFADFEQNMRAERELRARGLM